MSIPKIFCAVCQKSCYPSFEHIPPDGAFNNKPIAVKGHEHLFQKDSYLYGKTKKMRRGFGEYRICEDCNKYFGAHYNESYISIVKQINLFFETHELGKVNDIELSIQPLNFLKHIISNFITLNNGYLDDDEDMLKKFLLEKENQEFPNNYSIYLYTATKITPFWHGNKTTYEHGSIFNYTEMFFPPLGFRVYLNAPPIDTRMVNITEFKKYSHNESQRYIFRLPLFDNS